MANILLLHPFPLDHHFWDDVLPSLEARGHEVLAPDLPGFGARALEPGWTMDGEADALAPSIPQGAMVVGLSMGGYLALALMERHGERIGALVLADTRAEAESLDGLEARRATAEALRADGTAPFIDAFVPRAMWPGASGQAKARLAQLASAQTAEAMAEATMAIAGRTDYTALLPAIDVPTLVVVGEHDAVTPPPLSTAMAAAIPDGRLVIMGEAGHMSALEHPEEFAALLHEHAPA